MEVYGGWVKVCSIPPGGVVVTGSNPVVPTTSCRYYTGSIPGLYLSLPDTLYVLGVASRIWLLDSVFGRDSFASCLLFRAPGVRVLY